jgi:hypothetical protein
MHRVIFSIMALSIAAGGPALAQTSPTKPPSTSTQTSQNNQAGQLATAQKLRDDLEKAGFITDVKIVAESFVIQARSKNGDPVLMTIGPRGMSVFETHNDSNVNSGTTGSTTGQTNSTGQPR